MIRGGAGFDLVMSIFGTVWSAKVVWERIVILKTFFSCVGGCGEEMGLNFSPFDHSFSYEHCSTSSKRCFGGGVGAPNHVTFLQNF